MYEITSLFTYPVKSCRVKSVTSMILDEFGPQFDRRFMLVDERLKHVTQRTEPAMANIGAEFDGEALTIQIEKQSFRILLSSFNQPVDVSVWADNVQALGLSVKGDLDGEHAGYERHIDKVLSKYLDKPVQLVFMPVSTFRQVDPDFAKQRARVSFADGFPLLLCNEASLADLNARLEQPVLMDRFRPNIVISGAPAYAESSWKRVRVGGVEFDLVKPCSRCSMITLDESGAFHKEPLKTLASYRFNDFGACFGENLVHRQEGVLELGMQLEVLA